MAVLALAHIAAPDTCFHYANRRMFSGFAGTEMMSDVGYPKLLPVRQVSKLVPRDQHDAYQALPPAWRAVAVARLSAIREFAEASGGKTALAGSLAQRLEMSRSRFYQLVKAWEDSGSVDALVPYAAARVQTRQRKSRLDQERYDLLDKTIQSTLSASPAATKSHVFQEVERAFAKKALPAPSFSTVSRAFEARLERYAPASAVRRSRRLDVPEGYGSSIAIDHADLMFRDSEVATITLVIDAYTRTVVGLALGSGHPDVRAVSTALLWALRKPLVPADPLFAKQTKTPEMSLLALNVDRNPNWRKFNQIIEEIDGRIDVRAYASVVSGTFAQGLVGKRLGHYDLRYRRFHAQQKADRRWKHRDDIDTLRSVEAAVKEYNRGRLAAMPPSGHDVAAPPPMLFGVRGTELQDYLESILISE